MNFIISDLSGNTMTHAKKISMLARDLLTKYDMSGDEETVLRLELIENLSEQIIAQSEEIQQNIL